MPARFLWSKGMSGYPYCSSTFIITTFSREAIGQALGVNSSAIFSGRTFTFFPSTLRYPLLWSSVKKGRVKVEKIKSRVGFPCTFIKSSTLQRGSSDNTFMIKEILRWITNSLSFCFIRRRAFLPLIWSFPSFYPNTLSHTRWNKRFHQLLNFRYRRLWPSLSFRKSYNVLALILILSIASRLDSVLI